MNDNGRFHARRTLLVLLAAALVSGCSVVNSFEPEVFRFDDGQITIKGWMDAKQERFHVKIHLVPGGPGVMLHSLNLVRPDGTKVAADSWQDETPRSSAPSMAFGVGFGVGGHERPGYPRDVHEDVPEEVPHDGGGISPGGGGSTAVGGGLVIPLSANSAGKPVTDVSASWKTGETLRVSDPDECDLEINFVRVDEEEIALVTLVLAMAYHEDEQEKPQEERKTEDEKETTKNLIREIDFTQKGPVKTRSLDV